MIVNEKLKLWLAENGWASEYNSDKYDHLKNKILSRYKGLPTGFISILEEFSNISSKDDTTWFLCGKDYLDESEDSFKCNEFELMSLEAADGDEKWQAEIRDWWKEKLPFIMSVKDGYSYYAIDLEENNGAIIFGQEPEFEESTVVARNFDEFIDKLAKKEIVL